ncbi:hypothetical protein [Streptomyces aurantiogriseus]|uniref:Uncharacterized protein n=1 Tax=Streptomyces aurantiogriseus TaxID=66870 RepID=A0A918FNR0_9ACTN|nr:hypothetical protein [Streptomyces aurantiogriseus]GGR61446.1 hypothetical protein GCM10010251_92850 [Streptomyces aurantiogriseus]
MAKQSGLGDNFYLHGYDVSGDIGSISTSGGPALLEVTGIDKSAYERIGGLRTGGMSWQAWFNPAANQAHARMKTLPTTDVHCAYFRGTTLGNPAACMVAKQINYDGNRGADGSFTFAVEAQSNAFGLEWGRSLTAGVRTDTAATNGASIDTTASADFGAQAYLQAFAFSGTDVTVKIQDSADNSSFTDVAGLSFTQLTAGRTAERIATANTATIRRYVRAVTVTTGGFSSLAFAVVIVKNSTAGQVF